MGKKDDHPTHAGEDAVHQQVPEESGRHRPLQPSPGGGKSDIDPLHRIGGDGKDGGEQQGEDSREHAPAGHGIQDQRINPVRPSQMGLPVSHPGLTEHLFEVGVAGLDHGRRPVIRLLAKAFPPGSRQFPRAFRPVLTSGKQFQGPSLGAQFGRKGVPPGGGNLPNGRGQLRGHHPAAFSRIGKFLSQRGPQFHQSLSPRGHGGQELHPHPLAQLPGPDPDAARLRQVHHIEGHQHGDAEFHHLGDEKKVPLEVAGVDHAENGIGLGNAVGFPLQDLPGDLLVGRAGREAVHTGQINQFDRLAMQGVGGTCPFFHRYPGIVAHTLTQAGESVEECAFAGVGIADHRNPAAGLVLAQGDLGVSVDGLDEDLPGEPCAQRNPGAADPADQVSPTPDFSDHGILTKAHFPEPLAGAGGAIQPAHPDFASSPHLGQVHCLHFSDIFWAY